MSTDGKASYWLRKASAALDCAVQCSGDERTKEIDEMEARCDELAQHYARTGN